MQEPALPLILLPGTLCDARVFGPLRDRLAGIATEVLLTSDACSIGEAAEQVLAQAPGRFALLGFSLGGIIAMEVVLRAPERVEALALLSTTPFPVPPDRHRARRDATEQARRMGFGAYLREQLLPDYGSATQAACTLPLLESMAESLGHEAFSRQTEQALSRDDYRPRLASLCCPTLVLAGADDRLCSPAVQRELVAALPSCTAVSVPGAGHLALLEQADKVAAAVAAWFHTAAQCDERSGRPSGKEKA